MKRKVLLLAIALMLVATGVVSAAANWGKFEGYNIVKLVVNGKEVVPKDTPPVILKGRTMVPISLLEEAGIKVSWDKDSYTVNVESRSEFVSEHEFIEFNKVMQSHRAFITFIDQIELTSISIDLMNKYSNNAQYNQAMQQVNRINITGLDGWVEILKMLEVKESSNFSLIADNIFNAKEYLISGDTSAAFTEMISAKTKMNALYLTLDLNYNNTFGIKNQERFK